MMDSRFDTITVPDPSPIVTDSGASATNTGALLTQANNIPLRVIVRNISVGIDVLLTFNPATSNIQPPTSDTYTLPPGAADTFVLAPRQKLVVFAAAPGARVSVGVSEALPMDGSKAIAD